MTLTLVLGGARSGKSRFAQGAAETAATAGRPLSMIVTAESFDGEMAFDAEMADRIARHRADRGPAWRTVEAPTGLAQAIGALGEGDVAVVDCLTLWLTNVMLGESELAAEIAALLAALRACPARLWLVSNEVGWGLVPETPLGRAFRDEAGRLHQQITGIADEAFLIVAGLPLRLKPPA